MSSYSLNTHLQAALKHLPVIASAISLLLACLTLLGWVFDKSPLVNFFTGGHGMSPSSMVAFLFAGASLGLWQSSPSGPFSRPTLALARGLALLVSGIGLLGTIDILLGAEPSFEQRLFARLFFYDSPEAIKAAAPQSSLSFIFLGTALLLLDRQTLRARMQVYLSACVVLLIGMLSLLGYGFGSKALYEMTPARGIAIHTAATLVLLSLGVLSLRIDLGLMRVLTGQNLSGLVARRLLVAAVSVPLLLAVVAIIGERIGRYDSAFGAALLIVLNITIFIGLIWRSVEMLDKVETERQQSEAILQQAYEGLEQRVNDRTAELEVANEELKREIAGREKIEQERERLLVSEQAAREQAEKDSRLKDEFLNTVSHELRAPLNTILGWVSLLRAGKLDAAEIERALGTVERGARELDQRVNDLLDVSRLASGRLQLQIRPVVLTDVIKAAVAAVRPAATAKGIHLQTTVEPASEQIAERTSEPAGVGTAPPWGVWGDAGRLQQVVWNLVANAIKFTPAGGRVIVELRRPQLKKLKKLEDLENTENSQNAEQIEIRVRDTGVGIAADVLPFVFDHFRQADGSRTRQQRGLGIGLSIVRHLVEMHGGTISIESAGLGQGVVSIVRLPAMKNHWRRPDTKHPETGYATYVKMESRLAEKRPANLQGLRILVIDDDSNSRHLIADALSECQVVVRTAGSLEESLLVLSSWTPDMVILDIGLHRLDNEELANRLQDLEGARGEKIPVIALTEYGRVEDRLDALQAGFKMQVPKPVEPAELLTVVSNLATRVNNRLYL